MSIDLSKQRIGRTPRFCERCKLAIMNWPRGGAIIENEDGTQEMKVCRKCLEYILNLRGVQVVKDNINRG